MKPIQFNEQTVVIAKNQVPYLPFPAYRSPHADGEIVACWSLSLRERIRVLFTGVIWHHVLTFNTALQPQKLSAYKPDMP